MIISGETGWTQARRDNIVPSMLATETRITYRQILAIALPMVISQASETFMMLADRYFLSFVSMEALAAAMSGGLSNFVFQSLFIGLIGYTNALVAQYYGADKLHRGVRTVTQGIILSIIAYPVTLALIPLGRLSFVWAGHGEVQIATEYAYFSILMFGALFGFLRTTFSGFFIGIGKTRVVLLANFAGMLVNVPLNYVLIFGKLGLPAMGIRGAALGTLGGAMLTVLIMAVAYLRNAEYREHRQERSWRYDRKIMASLLRFGAPAGVEMFLNVMAFNIGLQLLHSYGVGVAAAVTITFNYDMVAFIPMLGLGFATTSIVGRYMGAGNPELARKAGFKAWSLSMIYGLLIMGLFIFGAGPLVSVFSASFTEGDGEFLALARQMLRLAALYTFADMSQLLFSSIVCGRRCENGESPESSMSITEHHLRRTGSNWDVLPLKSGCAMPDPTAPRERAKLNGSFAPFAVSFSPSWLMNCPWMR
jgi:MATE family multidrug resistance protein